MEASIKDNDDYDEIIEPDILFDQIFALNSNLAFEDKIMKRVEQMLEEKNKKILELEEKIDKIINFNEEIIKNKELEISRLKENFDEFKKMSDKNLKLSENNIKDLITKNRLNEYQIQQRNFTLNELIKNKLHRFKILNSDIEVKYIDYSLVSEQLNQIYRGINLNKYETGKTIIFKEFNHDPIKTIVMKGIEFENADFSDKLLHSIGKLGMSCGGFTYPMCLHSTIKSIKCMRAYINHCGLHTRGNRKNSHICWRVEIALINVEQENNHKRGLNIEIIPHINKLNQY